VCGSQTWNTLVEAGFRLGDRFLYRRTPMLRGDDVAELQQRLCTLGFDTGRVDGIFGDATVRALGEFQRNAGLPIDGIVGGATLAELLRLESRHHDPELVSAVRARAALREIAQGRHGGLDARVVGDRPVRQRHVEVLAHEHALAADVELGDALGHRAATGSLARTNAVRSAMRHE